MSWQKYDSLNMHNDCIHVHIVVLLFRNLVDMMATFDSQAVKALRDPSDCGTMHCNVATATSCEIWFTPTLASLHITSSTSCELQCHSQSTKKYIWIGALLQHCSNLSLIYSRFRVNSRQNKLCTICSAHATCYALWLLPSSLKQPLICLWFSLKTSIYNN